MKQRNRNFSAILVSLVVTLSLVALLFFGVRWEGFIAQFEKINLIYFPVLLGLHLISLWLRAIRWRFLFASGESLSQRRLMESIALGFFASYVLPLRAGEFVRPWVLSRWQPVSFSAGFASVVLERVFDVLAVMILLGSCFSLLDSTPVLVRAGASALLIVGCGVTLLCLATYFWTEKFLAIWAKVIERIFGNSRPELKAKLYSMSEDFLAGLKVISNFRQFLFSLGWTAILWYSIVLFYQVSLLSFGSSASLEMSIMLTVMTALAVAAPSAPGFLGTFQAGCVVALTGVYGLPRELALAYSVVVHAYMFLFTIAIGLVILWMEGLKFRELMNNGIAKRLTANEHEVMRRGEELTRINANKRE